MRTEGTAALDHFVVAISDLTDGMTEFERLTGVRPAFGGEHGDFGTHNALVSLRPGLYLEILSPRPGIQVHHLLREIADADVLTPFMWAVATSDIEATSRVLVASEYRMRDVISANRITPDGIAFRWTALFFDEPTLANAPFFIEWHDASAHPSESAPVGCELASFSIIDPRARDLRRVLDTIDLEANVVAGTPARMRIELHTPNGRVAL